MTTASIVQEQLAARHDDREEYKGKYNGVEHLYSSLSLIASIHGEWPRTSGEYEMAYSKKGSVNLRTGNERIWLGETEGQIRDQGLE